MPRGREKRKNEKFLYTEALHLFLLIVDLWPIVPIYEFICQWLIPNMLYKYISH